MYNIDWLKNKIVSNNIKKVPIKMAASSFILKSKTVWRKNIPASHVDNVPQLLWVIPKVSAEESDKILRHLLFSVVVMT